MNSTCLQIKPDPPKDEWEPTKQSFWIRTGQDLWRVAHKSKFARLTVPSLEFEIQADGQRHIDSIYNHFGNAVTNLAAYASSLVMGVSLLSDRMSDLADDPCRGSKAAAAMPGKLRSIAAIAASMAKRVVAGLSLIRVGRIVEAPKR